MGAFHAIRHLEPAQIEALQAEFTSFTWWADNSLQEMAKDALERFSFSREEPWDIKAILMAATVLMGAETNTNEGALGSSWRAQQRTRCELEAALKLWQQAAGLSCEQEKRRFIELGVICQLYARRK